MSQPHAPPAVTEPVLHLHADAAGWVDAVASDIAANLRDALATDARARLLLSGGSTPAPVYRALSALALDWPRVDIGLADERWLPSGHADSNSRLVDESLLHGAASAANFIAPLRCTDLPAAVAYLNRTAAPASVLVLGMGQDGHTASLFPGMRDLEAALSDPNYYIAVDATGCSVAGAFAKRISLTAAGLARADHRILLLRGNDKRELLARALAGDDPHELPVRLLLRAPGRPLQIHWCP